MRGNYFFPIALIAVALMAGCHQTPEYDSRYTPPQSAPIPNTRTAFVAIIGDSLTGGTAMGGNGARGWPAIVRTKLRSKGVDIIQQVGSDGDSGYVARGSTGTAFADEVQKVAGPRTNLVVVEGSGNDAQASTDELKQGIQATIEKVARVSPRAKLLLIGPPVVDKSKASQLSRVRDVLEAESVNAGATFLDPIDDGWFGTQEDILIGPDGAHPTDGGHAYMAERIAPVIARILAPN